MRYFQSFKIRLIIFLVIIFLISGFYSKNILHFNNIIVQAADDECAVINLTVIARDTHGDFIPSISFQVFRQVEDVDGKPKPGKQVAAGVIDKNLGKKIVKFKDDYGSYALKMWQIDKPSAYFYFYNDIFASCGDTLEVEEILSSIKMTLRDTDRKLRKNTQLSIFTQRYDADHKPIKEKQDLIATKNTSNEGEVLIYVPESTTSIDGEGTDYYVMEVMSEDDKKFTEYDIQVPSSGEADINYIFSKLELRVRDSKDVLFPAGIKIEIFKQELDENDDYVLGEKQKNILTNDYGVATLEYPIGTYVARIKGANDKYQYFWNLEIYENDKSSYDLYSEENWDPGVGACDTKSTVTIITRDIKGENIPNLKFEIYEQTTDVDDVPKVGTKILNSTIDKYGKGVVSFNPDPRKTYALKIYKTNATVGDYWFYNAMQFECGENKEISEKLPAINFILRNASGDLYKNQKFSLYTQKFDVDGKPIKEKKDLVSADFVTSARGIATVYVAFDHPYDKEKKGTYVFEVKKNSGSDIFREFGITVPYDKNVDFEYIFSDIVLEIRNANNSILANKEVSLYEQVRNLNGDYELGKLLKTKKTDENGFWSIEYPAGYYAMVIKDGIGKKNIFWNIQIKNRLHNEKTIVTNLIKIKVYDIEGNARPKGTVIRVYSMLEDEDGYFYKNKKIKEITVGAMGYAQITLSPQAYLFTFFNNKVEYGKVLYTENNKLQNIAIKANNNDRITKAQKFSITKPNIFASLTDRLSGKILLQVEGRGEAWYVDTKTKFRYYMKDGASAYNMMRKFGLGITNEDLNKIPIGLDERFEEYDYDGDLVFDKMEKAIGTDMYLADSDEDGYNDGVEVLHDYNPLGSGVMALDLRLTNKLKGKILLQVESHGEAWYINPSDGRRYYMSDGESAYEIMRFLSLGITNSNLKQIPIGFVGE